MIESLYNRANTRLTRLKNTGFDYQGKIFEKSISPYIMGEAKRREILNEFEKLIYFMIEKVKYIKTFYNYTVDKDYNRLN
jgi:hypothetical protein